MSPILHLLSLSQSLEVDSDQSKACLDDEGGRAHICHKYHELYSWRKYCHVEKFGLSIKNLNNLWSFIEIYAIFVLNLCGEKSMWENLCGEKMTNMRCAPLTPSCLMKGGTRLQRSLPL